MPKSLFAPFHFIAPNIEHCARVVSSYGSKPHLNEDAAILSPELFVVFDGATCLVPSTLPLKRLNEAFFSDAQWFVAGLTQLLPYFFSQTQSFLSALSLTVDALRSDYLLLTELPALPSSEFLPMASMIAVCLEGSQYNAYRLGDCDLFLSGQTLSAPLTQWHQTLPNSTLRPFHTPFHRTVDDANLQHFARAIADGLSPASARQKITPDILSSRQRANTPAGHQVLSLNSNLPSTVETIQNIHFEQALLATDGFLPLFDHYPIGSHLNTFAGALSSLRRFELADPLQLSPLRFKPHDDATALLLTRPSFL